ncbi:L-threonine dehydratase catabolic TdcB-like [Saccoglossus kowalevskii]|uniref:L-serine ammonia-lyase n=1 Tax=Saccoglossus kowalevskii TaxID=10224 RepID=A0ABM0MSI9_SACKO|nr:PREDICTED: threonine dehydratase biosynthetic, chloroplastic-like [Saccoglossus kowalevskii]
MVAVYHLFDVFFLDSEQITHSFKARGAFNNIIKLVESGQEARLKKKGLTTTSSGNAGIGYALACHTFGIPLQVHVPDQITELKERMMVKYSAEVIKHKLDYMDIITMAETSARVRGTELIDSCNYIDVLGGNGTVGLEILNDLPDVDVIFLPVGGGSLISSTAVYVKTVNPKIQIIGCQPETNSAMEHLVRTGKYDKLLLQDTISDATEGDVYENSVIETASALPIAAFLSVAEDYRDKKVALVITGSNIGCEKIKYILQNYSQHTF